MIEWSIDAFRACASVHSIVVACPPGHVGDLGGHDLGVVPGGETRAQSVANALEAVGTGYVAIHDAARPLLTPELVEALIADLDTDEDAAGVIAAAPVNDTIKRAAESANLQLTPPEGVNHRLVIEATEDRSRLWRAQTPQLFRTDRLREALAAPERPEDATDESMLVEAVGGTVLIHPVAEQNLKVTTPLDLQVAELLLQSRIST
jgi:2-C-methyl-D-erythritol 4-phosphate cytidylyltransferase